MPDPYYPAPGFYFSVSLVGLGTPLFLLSGRDASFQEIRGIEAKFEVEEVQEGGENRYVHQLPKAAKYPNLVLMRGFVAADSYLAEWTSSTIGAKLNERISPQTLVVNLLDPSATPLIAWVFIRSWPVRWTVGNLNSMKNDILTEELEFHYDYVQRVPVAGLATFLARLATGI